MEKTTQYICVRWFKRKCLNDQKRRFSHHSMIDHLYNICMIPFNMTTTEAPLVGFSMMPHTCENGLLSNHFSRYVPSLSLDGIVLYMDLCHL